MIDRKMLRRLILPILAAGALAALSGCGQQPQKKTDPNVFMKEEGIRLTQRMGNLAGSSEYRQLMGGSEPLQDQVSALGTPDYSVPEAVYTLDISDDFALRILGGEKIELSPEIAKEVHGRMNAGFFANLVNGTYGAETIASVSILTCRQDYAEPEGWQGDTLLVLTYSGDYSSLVTFMSSGEGIIEASACFVRTGDKAFMDRFFEILSIDPSLFKKMD